MPNDYRRMTPQQREADRERRRIGRERRAAEKALKLGNHAEGKGTSHVPSVDSFMRRDWRAGYHHQAETFPDLHDETQGAKDGESEADRAWTHAQFVRSEMPRLELSLADLIEIIAPVRRRGGKKKALKRAVEADDGFSVLGSEAGTEMWSDMGEEELASVLAALDEEAEEGWEVWAEDVPTATTQAVTTEAER
ncbi:hypothetical protein PENSPDRAFT_653873 [Peniophora sp. CONT]|nr:hypothetical protein PENSPDRAFT_653873 [Peniophora sp. CONT]